MLDAVQELIQNEEKGHENMFWDVYLSEREALGADKVVVRLIRKWLKKNGNDAVPSAEFADMIDESLPAINSVLSIIKEHPDWDDEQVVDEADWDGDSDDYFDDDFDEG